MLAIMIRLLVLIAIVWLVRRFLAAAFGAKSSRQQKKAPEVQSSNMVKDPVCGMYMDSRLALRLDGRNEERYFCSEECRKKYLSRSSDVKGAGSAASV